jgi:uncharacterized protein (DUF169 family)
MAMDNQARGRALRDELHLERTPVALAFVDEAPAGVRESDHVVPSACTFWRLAERSVFYASAADHYECPIGVMTMGFELPSERQPAAEQLVGTMVELGYIGADEVAHVPSVGKAHRGIVYGPLEQFPIEPDVVVVIASPFQAMIVAEAGDAVKLRDAPAMPTLGRPACAAVAWTANQGTAALSLGCIGARTYVEVPDDRAVVVLPGAKLDDVVGRLSALNRANAALAEFHRGQKAQFGAAAG